MCLEYSLLMVLPIQLSVRPTLIFEARCVYTYHNSVQLDKWLDDNICIFAYFLIDTKKQTQQLTVGVTYKLGWLLFVLEDQN
jgi:hypothetical protein